MDKQTLNIVSIIENNPINCITNTDNNKLITKINENFTNDEQHMFIASFYSYLNYSKTDFVIDLDNIYKWIGFTRKDNCKNVLVKHFKIDIDYKVENLNDVNETKKVVPEISGTTRETVKVATVKDNGGSNKEKITMTIKTFKKLCLKANTKKSNDIHEYYIKLEEVLQEVIKEECDELKQQLTIKDKKNEEEKSVLLEKTLLEQFPINTQCVYYGSVDNKDTKNANLIKFGMSNNLQERVKAHKKTYTNFKLLTAFKVKNQIEIENCVKKHELLKKRIRNIMIDGNNYRELIATNEIYTLDKINIYFKEIIEENEYNIENYTKLLEKNLSLEDTIRKLQETIEKITKENEQLKLDKPKSPIDAHKFKVVHSTTKFGYTLYVFKCAKENRYKCGILKTLTIPAFEESCKLVDKNGSMIYQIPVKNGFLDKPLQFLLSKHLTLSGIKCYEGDINVIKTIFNIIMNTDEKYNNEDVNLINDWSNGKEIIINNSIEYDPEIPKIKKAKRSVDQINKDTGEIIKTYSSLEEAGKSNGLTGGTSIGIAIRNKSYSCGYLWRYSGVSHEDQYNDQKVIKINCKNGNETRFDNIASAAKDVGISAPGMRNRILTDCHINNFHWIFDKSATHYTNNSK